MTTALHVAILTDLAEPIRSTARLDSTLFAFELICALRELSEQLGELKVDVVARRGSDKMVPLISMEPDELAPGSTDPVRSFARREAAYCHLILRGLFEGYDVVHCLAPIVTPLQLLAGVGVPIVQTITYEPLHPSVLIPPRLISSDRIWQVQTDRPSADLLHNIPLPVDLTHFKPASDSTEEHLVWLGDGHPAEKRVAERVGTQVGLPLRSWDDGDPLHLIQHARALLHLRNQTGPLNVLWPLRALACGTAVVGWVGSGLEKVLKGPEMGAVAPLGDVRALAEAIVDLSPRQQVCQLRRLPILAQHAGRAVAAAYREVYRLMVEKTGRSR